MEENVLQKLEKQDAKLNAIYISTEKTRKYFLFIIWGSIAAFVIPAIGLMLAIPAFINSYASTLDGIL